MYDEFPEEEINENYEEVTDDREYMSVIKGSIIVEDANILKIWGQKYNLGGLLVKEGSDNAGIGSRKDHKCGVIEIHSGEVNVKNDTFFSFTTGGAGIGCGHYGQTGVVNILGDEIWAVGGYRSAGIGGGATCPSGKINISGGKVTAFGGEYAADRLKDEGVIDESSEIEVKSYEGLTPDDAKEIASDYENVVLVSELFKAAGLDPSTEDGKQAAFIDALIDSVHDSDGKFVLISSRLPYDTARYQKADGILVAYSDRGMTALPDEDGGSSIYGPNIPVAVYTAFGGNKPSGKLPIAIPKVNDDYTYSDEILYERGFGLDE